MFSGGAGPKPDKGKGLIVGGKFEKWSSLWVNDQDLSLDLEKNEFSLLPTTGAKPPPRCGFAAAISGDRFFTHGGNGGEGVDGRHISDFHALDLKSLVWTRLRGSGEALSCHTLSPLSPTQFLVVGGSNRVWIYDDDESTWTEEKRLPDSFCGENGEIRYHAAVEVKKEARVVSIVVLGGKYSYENYSQKLLTFDVESNTLKSIDS